MSKRMKKFLKNLEARIKISTVIALSIIIILSSMFIFLPNVMADTVWVNEDFEGGVEGDEIPDDSDWIDEGISEVTFKYDSTTVLSGGTSAYYNQTGDPGAYADSFVSYDNFTAITENCTLRFKVRINHSDQKTAIRFRETTSPYDGVSWMWDEHGSIAWVDGSTKYFYNSTGAGGAEDPATDIWYTDENYTYNFQINWSTQLYFVEYYNWSSGFYDYLCENNDGTGEWVSLLGTPSSLDNFTICGASIDADIGVFYDDIQISQGLYSITEELGGESTFSISGGEGSNNNITWSGEAGQTVWSNATSYGTLNITSVVNENVNCTEIRINLTDIDAGEGILATSISLTVSSDNTTWAGGDSSVNSTAYSGTNYTINSTQWTHANGFYGTDPFPINDETQSIYVRFLLAIPGGASAGTYTQTNWYVWWKVVP